tara:strand:- start:224 stop:1381 length:1158 start_codon:yes stop_codon:yes gene_type:complete
MLGLAILGSTGSIGSQCLDLVDRFPERFQVVSLAAGHSVEALLKQAQRYRPQLLSCATEEGALFLRDQLGDSAIEVVWGPEGPCRAVERDDVDTVVAAIVGAAGCRSTLAAAKAGKRIALANKESIVAAGPLLRASVDRYKAQVIPIDSEHAALHQCLVGETIDTVDALWLTASGGPFRGWSREQLAEVTPQQALQHPNWSMGPKITVDSASMMNKGLELIEACWLFGLPANQVHIAVHPSSTVHSMVAFRDGTWKAQLGAPDMRAAISYALTAPARLELLERSAVHSWNPIGQSLHFESYDEDLFPAPGLCREALTLGRGTPAALNAANEVLVARFLAGDLGFSAIGEGLKRCLDNNQDADFEDLDGLAQLDRSIRDWAQTWHP